MAGTCIISLDCESKWGMADHLTEVHDRLFIRDKLMQAYNDIIRILKNRRISATFAFVGALTLEQEYFADVWGQRLAQSPQHAAWLARLFDDLRARRTQGWFLPELLPLVLSSPTKHEIASHGFTHLPFDTATPEAIDIEIAGIRDWMRVKQVKIDSFVFPRNLVAKVDALRAIGVRGYRERPTVSHIGGNLGRLVHLLSEFNPYAASQVVRTTDQSPLPIPGDHFLNWRSGARGLVPRGVTIWRFTNALNHAAHTGGVVHLWLHPHNLITGNRQVGLFEQCMENLHTAVSKGQITVETQSQFIEKMKRASPAVTPGAMPSAHPA